MTPSIARQRRAKSQPQRGFSLIELVIVVAIIMVLLGLALTSMTNAMTSYRLNSTARSIATTVQLGRTKALARDARYRLARATAAYRMEFKLRPPGSPWTLDTATGELPLASGVGFSDTGIPAPPPGFGGTVTQAADMTFNTRGILIDDGTSAPLVGSCFYLQARRVRPVAVCTTMVGKTTVFRLAGGTWEAQ